MLQSDKREKTWQWCNHVSLLPSLRESTVKFWITKELFSRISACRALGSVMKLTENPWNAVSSIHRGSWLSGTIWSCTTYITVILQQLSFKPRYVLQVGPWHRSCRRSRDEISQAGQPSPSVFAYCKQSKTEGLVTRLALWSQNMLLSLLCVAKWSNAVWQGLPSPSPAVWFPQSLTSWSKTCLVFLSSRLSWKYQRRVYIYRMWMVLWAWACGKVVPFIYLALYQGFWFWVVIKIKCERPWHKMYMLMVNHIHWVSTCILQCDSPGFFPL